MRNAVQTAQWMEEYQGQKWNLCKLFADDASYEAEISTNAGHRASWVRMVSRGKLQRPRADLNEIQVLS
jgi:hypothetical protein